MGLAILIPAPPARGHDANPPAAVVLPPLPIVATLPPPRPLPTPLRRAAHVPGRRLQVALEAHAGQEGPAASQGAPGSREPALRDAQARRAPRRRHSPRAPLGPRRRALRTFFPTNTVHSVQPCALRGHAGELIARAGAANFCSRSEDAPEEEANRSGHRTCG
jgi:hypothetical protein